MFTYEDVLVEKVYSNRAFYINLHIYKSVENSEYEFLNSDDFIKLDAIWEQFVSTIFE